MKTSVFLDWFGVIADNELTTRRWRVVEAQLLHRRYGGSRAKWMSTHDRAFRWYLNYWSRYGPNISVDYRSIWRSCEIEWMRRTLTWGGAEPPPTERELFRLDRELTYKITRRIDAAYPHARNALKMLRRAGHRLFLVSGADSVYVKGALEATKLGEFFEDTFSPDSLNAFKGSLQYWKRILRRSKSNPESSVVVDDRPKFLATPAMLGLNTILVSPRISRHFKTIPSIKQLVSVIASGQVLRTRRRRILD